MYTLPAEFKIKTMGNSSTNPLVFGLAFTSGFIIMSVELLGGRILSPYFGSSIYVWGSVITIFMVALSLGYLIGGKLSLANANLGRYGWFYIIAAIALIPTILLGDGMMDAVFLRIEDPRYGSLMASTLLSGTLLPRAGELLDLPRRRAVRCGKLQ